MILKFGQVDLGYVFVLPERDSEGRRVIFNYAHVLDPARHTSTDMMKVFMATFETLLADPENQVVIRLVRTQFSSNKVLSENFFCSNAVF
jgi:hypothetical protein